MEGTGLPVRRHASFGEFVRKNPIIVAGTGLMTVSLVWGLSLMVSKEPTRKNWYILARQKTLSMQARIFFQVFTAATAAGVLYMGSKKNKNEDFQKHLEQLDNLKKEQH
eukprot:TRINITY_DN676_c0_g1_i1.p1 TRINITY_DN676_c0_g1~~TRINITY_DN676_c0_g1_i1.p1  ORF type:complete len:109 (+),score=36.88 TRINITY_DN676_c0_g1_i1:116-442(+)